MNSLQAIVLGIIQGLTEFLPISSTAHLRVIPALLGWKDPTAAFTAVIRLGTLAAVLIYFASDIRRLIGAWFTGLRHGIAVRHRSVPARLDDYRRHHSRGGVRRLVRGLHRDILEVALRDRGRGNWVGCRSDGRGDVP